MDPNYLILGSAFIGVLALVMGLMSLFQGRADTDLETRLIAFTGRSPANRGELASEILRDGLTTAQGFFGRLIQRFENLPLLFRQADSPIRVESFFVICFVSAAVVLLLATAMRLPNTLLPAAALAGFSMPWGWLLLRRRKRIRSFEKQLPDALELLSRALRSGNSLAAGLNVVATEMPAPISMEFRNVYEEQNLGVPVDQALRNMLLRMPNMDLQFFVTAVAIQRQAGGDLAEILGKISSLVRERFKILGQVKALTGEGRMSGAVLMALPIVLFFTVYTLNPDYVALLFNRDLGRKMIFCAVAAQCFGGYVIHRIVNIKV
ncbi:MAG: type II secretion system F family protein [Planctomycetia bacterium]